MKSFGIILLLAVASCQGNTDVVRTERSVSDSMAGLAEQVREMMIEGNDELGIPVLEPFHMEEADFAIDSDMAKLAASVSDLIVNGLAGFEANTLTFSLIGVRFTYALRWPAIKLNTKYNIDGSVASMLPIFGTGDLSNLRLVTWLVLACFILCRIFSFHSLELTDVTVAGTITLTTSGGFLVIRTSTVEIGVGDVDMKVTGLLDDEALSHLISAVVTDMAPEMLEKFSPQINSLANDMIVSAGNEILGTMTLGELISMVTG